MSAPKRQVRRAPAAAPAPPPVVENVLADAVEVADEVEDVALTPPRLSLRQQALLRQIEKDQAVTHYIVGTRQLKMNGEVLEAGTRLSRDTVHSWPRWEAWVRSKRVIAA